MNPSFHFFLYFFFRRNESGSQPNGLFLYFHSFWCTFSPRRNKYEMVTRGILHGRTYVHNGETLKFGHSTILCFEAEKMFLIRLRFIAGT